MTAVQRIYSAAVGLGVAAIGLLAIVGVIHSDPGGIEGLLFSIAAIIFGIVGAWIIAFRPRVILTDTDVTIVNPIRTTVIPLDRIDPAVHGTYHGVRINALIDGRMQTTVAWAVQKANISNWFGWHTRADVVSEAIAAAAARVQRG